MKMSSRTVHRLSIAGFLACYVAMMASIPAGAVMPDNWKSAFCLTIGCLALIGAVAILISQRVRIDDRRR
jgi:hypothetical protein